MRIKKVDAGYKLSLSGAEFLHYFEMFSSAAVKKGAKWKKMPYETWRDLKQHDSNIGAVITYNPLRGAIAVDAGKKYCEEVRVAGTACCPRRTFHYGDVSFGQFLYDKFIKEEVAMMESNSTNITMNNRTDYGHALNDYVNGTAAISTATINGTFDIQSYDMIATHSNVNDAIREHENKYHNNVKENETMKFGNFDFGPCTNDNIRMSMYGLAVKNTSGSWVSYDANSLSIMDVDCFNFEGGKYLYKMPVAIHDIAIGDVVIHARRPMFVVAVDTHTLTVVDPVDGEAKSIMPTKSPFGFNFATKVVNLLGGMMDGVNANNPFGNMWMLMLMDDKSKSNDMLPLMMMMNGGNANMNPMMMYMLMKDGNMSDNMLPLMLMMNGGNMFPNQNCGRGNHRCGGHTVVYDPAMPDPDACEVPTEEVEG